MIKSIDDNRTTIITATKATVGKITKYVLIDTIFFTYNLDISRFLNVYIFRIIKKIQIDIRK